ncbi:MAG: OmpA family protein [Desulfobacterales bacterium]
MKKKKMMFCVSLCCAVLLFSGLFAGTALSEVRQGSASLSLMGGGYFFDDELDVLDKGISGGLGLSYSFTPNLAAELGFTFIYEEADLCCCEDRDFEVYAYQPRADLLYHIMPESRFVPYLAAGVAYMLYDDDNLDPLEIDDTVQANAGLGAKFFLTDNIGLRADARYYYGFEDSSSEYALTAGLVFQMGGARKAEEPCADTDNDGVCDDVDRCPDTPAGAEVDSAGCTKAEPYVKMEKTEGTGQVMEKSDEPAPAPVPAPAPEMMSVTVWFDFDRTIIKSEYRARLEEFAAFMQQYPDTRAVIEGHTDSVGSERYNLRLSEKRAQSVKRYLTEHFGIDPARISIQGFGESRPEATNKTAAGRAQNRRAISITILK